MFVYRRATSYSSWENLMKTFRNYLIKFMIFSGKTALLQSYMGYIQSGVKKLKSCLYVELWENNFVGKSVI